MQIKTITVNAVSTAMVQNGQRYNTPEQVNNNMFGPQCKVTISTEGKRLSSQQGQQPQENTQEAALRRMMLHWNEESEQNEQITEGYREQLRGIQKQITSLNKSFSKETNREIIMDELEVLESIRHQKQTQLKDNQKHAGDAQELSMMSSKNQEDIDGNNRKLWTLLKTLEEAEKAEEERKGVYEDDNNAPKEEISVGDTIQNSATRFIAASMGRDLFVDGKLEGLRDKGHQYIDLANMITGNILEESKNIMAALDDENYTDDMRAELMDRFQEDALKSYDKVKKYRGYGLDILQDTRDYKIKRIADNPLAGMQETKVRMMMFAADSVLGEARQSRLDETSKELEDEVQKLIDRRNDLNRTQEEIEENDKTEDSKELSEKEKDDKTVASRKLEEKEEDILAEILNELI